ncbi:MAG: restriction endonuclease [Boseongicola sp.]|nr:restriction endonuclease [Boseongicola sp.]
MARRFIIKKDAYPDLPGMMLVTLEALGEMGGSANIHELDEKVIEIEGLTEEEQSYEMSNDDPRLRVNYYLAWARTYLRRGEAVENSSRGVWALTTKGSLINSIEETRAIRDQVNEEEKQRAKERRKKAAEKRQKKSSVSNEPQLELIETQREIEQYEEDWKTSLLETVRKMSPDAFERLSQRMLRESGFTKVEVRGKSGDGGIDGVGVLRVNLVSFQIYFQCKKWKGSVGSKEIRDFRGALQGRADKGLFITTGNFTAQASDEATRDGAIAIDLIDGERLCELLKSNGLGVTTTMIEHVEIDTTWFKSV